MKFHIARTLSPIVLVVGLFASPAYAGGPQSTTAFSSFHVQSATPLSEDAYLCLTEDNGAVVNNCSYPVNLVFDLPIHNGVNDTVHTISVQGYWYFPSGASFNCVSYGYTGLMSSSNVGTQITFTAASQALKTKVAVPNNPGGLNGSMQLICWQVPPGAGIANLNW